MHPVIQRRDLVLLCTATAAAALGFTMLGLLTPLVAVRAGAGPAAVGALVSAGYVLPLLLAVPVGTWVDRFGARRMVRLGFLLFGAAAVPVAVQPSWTVLLVAFGIANLAHLVYIVGSQTLVASLGEGSGRESAYGWWSTSIAAGQSVGPLLGGSLLDLCGPGVAFAAITVAMWTAFALALRLRTSGRADGPAVRFSPAAARRWLGDRSVALAVLTSSAALWAVTVQLTFLPVHLELRAVPAAVIGGLLSLRAVVAVLVRPWMPRMVVWLGGRERTVVVTLLAMAVGTAGVAVSASWWWLAALMLVFGVGFGLSQPVSMVMVADRVGAGERGAVLGLRLTGNRFAQVAAPAVLAVVAERAGLPVVFVLHGLIVFVAAAVLVAWTRRPSPPPGAPPAA